MVAGSEQAGLERVRGRFDFVASTVSAQLPWDAYLATLRPHGRLSLLGVARGNIRMSPLSLLPGERTVAGGITGGPSLVRTMLEFVARHGIRPQVEVYEASKFDEALERTRRGAARYRVVVDLR